MSPRLRPPARRQDGPPTSRCRTSSQNRAENPLPVLGQSLSPYQLNTEFVHFEPRRVPARLFFVFVTAQPFARGMRIPRLGQKVGSNRLCGQPDSSGFVCQRGVSLRSTP